MAAEYQEHFGEHNYDEEGNYIGVESSEGQEAWAEYYNEHDPTEPAVAEAEQTESSDEAETDTKVEETVEVVDPEKATQDDMSADEVGATEEDAQDESEEEKADSQE